MVLCVRVQHLELIVTVGMVVVVRVVEHDSSMAVLLWRNKKVLSDALEHTRHGFLDHGGGRLGGLDIVLEESHI